MGLRLKYVRQLLSGRTLFMKILSLFYPYSGQALSKSFKDYMTQFREKFYLSIKQKSFQIIA
jgi:hypothetical protein